MMRTYTVTKMTSDNKVILVQRRKVIKLDNTLTVQIYVNSSTFETRDRFQSLNFVSGIFVLVFLFTY